MTVDQETTELEQEFESRAAEEAPEEEPATVEEPQEEEPEDESAAESDIDPAQAERLYRYFQARPDMAQALVALEQGKGRLITEEEQQPQLEQQAEEFNFWTDPEATVRELHSRLQAQESYIANQTHSQNLASIHTGKQLFSQSHPDLKPEEVEDITSDLVRRQVLPTYWAQNPNYLGVQQALEDVYRVKYFDRSREQVAKDMSKANKQKRRAAAVGTSRASSPRTEPIPQDRTERKQAMVKEIEEWLNQ